jgi:site-specific recombinase XerD
MALNPDFTLAGDDLAAWRRYARFHAERGHSPRTTENSAAAIVFLAEYLQARRLGSVLGASREKVSDFLVALREVRGNSPATVRNRHAALRAFYRFAVTEEMIEVSPAEQVGAPAADYRVPRVVPDAELAALIGACKTAKGSPASMRFAGLRDEAMIRVLCEAGSPRASELANLLVADVDLKADTITIRCGKNRLDRVIAMGPKTARAMDRYLWARARHPRAAQSPALWFSATSGDHVITRSGVGQLLERRSAQAGIPKVYPHQLRHTAFSDFDAASGNVNHAMALFGWSSSAMVYHYGKDARARRAVEAARGLHRGDRL